VAPGIAERELNSCTLVRSSAAKIPALGPLARSPAGLAAVRSRRLVHRSTEPAEQSSNQNIESNGMEREALGTIVAAMNEGRFLILTQGSPI
jgi:hypothetical protein